MLDNLGSHKGVATRKAIRAACAHLLFLPPYSPDLNPIDMMFAKLKTLLRKAGERSVAVVWNRIGTLLESFTAAKCANYLRHAWYDQSGCDNALVVWPGNGAGPRGRDRSGSFQPRSPEMQPSSFGELTRRIHA